MTFTSSAGSDALASGIRLDEMWVGRIDGCTEGRWRDCCNADWECY